MQHKSFYQPHRTCALACLGFASLYGVLLEDAKVAVNLQAKDGATLLFGACKRSHTKVVSLLLQHEQINVTTPLCAASQEEGHDAKVVPLLSQHEQTNVNR